MRLLPCLAAIALLAGCSGPSMDNIPESPPALISSPFGLYDGSFVYSGADVRVEFQYGYAAKAVRPDGQVVGAEVFRLLVVSSGIVFTNHVFLDESHRVIGFRTSCVLMERSTGPACIAERVIYATSGSSPPLLLFVDPKMDQQVQFAINGQVVSVPYVSEALPGGCWRVQSREAIVLPEDAFGTPPALLPPRSATFCGDSPVPKDWVTADSRGIAFTLSTAAEALGVTSPEVAPTEFPQLRTGQEGPVGPAPWDPFPIADAIAAGSTDVSTRSYLQQHPNARVIRAHEQLPSNASIPLGGISGASTPSATAQTIVREIVLADIGASEGFQMTASRTATSFGGSLDQVTEGRATSVDDVISRSLQPTHISPDAAFEIVAPRIGTAFKTFEAEAQPTGLYTYRFDFEGESEGIFQFAHTAQWWSDGRLLHVLGPLAAADSLLPSGTLPPQRI